MKKYILVALLATGLIGSTTAFSQDVPSSVKKERKMEKKEEKMNKKECVGSERKALKKKEKKEKKADKHLLKEEKGK